MLGSDMTLPNTLVTDPRWDYVALGHIHKAQNLNDRSHPPVIYPGSIERVDFGEAGDRKCFVIAEIDHGASQVIWRYLDDVRPFLDCGVTLSEPDQVTEKILTSLPKQDVMEGAIIRLTVTYPREMESLIDEPLIRKASERAFEFHLVRKPQSALRSRLSPDQMASSLNPLDLLDQYWLANQMPADEDLRTLASEIIEDVPGGDIQP
jgi:exonuclease SbcD